MCSRVWFDVLVQYKTMCNKFCASLIFQTGTINSFSNYFCFMQAQNANIVHQYELCTQRKLFSFKGFYVFVVFTTCTNKIQYTLYVYCIVYSNCFLLDDYSAFISDTPQKNCALNSIRLREHGFVKIILLRWTVQYICFKIVAKTPREKLE